MAERPEDIREKASLFEQKLRAQTELYGTLLGLAKRQVQEISAENIDAFTLLLDDKKKVIEELGEIEAATIPLRQYWEAHMDQADEETRARLRTVVNRIRGILEELLEVEADSQKQLGMAKDEIEEQIRQVGSGGQAMRSYAPSPDHKPRFMDKSG